MGLDESLADASDEKLVESVRLGNERAIEMLLLRYRHYARAKARTYFLAGADKEDIVQEGMIGLYKAIRDFEPHRSNAFRAFAELCITRQIITAIKNATRQKHIPLNSYVSLAKAASEEGSTTIGESLPAERLSDPAEVVISAEELAGLRSSLDEILSELETEVLSMYMEGKSYQEIADGLGRHVKSIDNALQRIKRKLAPEVQARDAR